MALPVDSTLALFSGVPLALLGAGLLWLKPRRSDQVFFGLFAVLWGVQVVTANLGLVLDSASVFRTSFLITLGITPAATLFLGQFAAAMSGKGWAKTLPWILGLLAIIHTGILLVSPEQILASVTATADGGLGQVELGPLAFPLGSIPFFGVFYLVLLVAYQRYREAPSGSERHRYRGILLALALYTSYQTVTNISTYFFGHPGVLAPANVILSQGLFAAGALVVVGLVIHVALFPPPPDNIDRGLLAAFLIPAGIAVIAESSWGFDSSFRPWGLWRLLTVAVLAHAIARYQLFDLDLRLKRIAGPGLAAASLALGALVSLTFVLGEMELAAASAPLLVGTVAAGGFTVGRDRVAEALFPGVTEDPAYLKRRKLEVYQAALQRVMADGSRATEDDTILQDLRRSLGIEQRYHETLVARMAADPQKAHGGQGGDPERVVPGTLIDGRYRVDRLLGEGGHGRAYLAYDEQADREVALKVVGGGMGAKGISMLRREAEVLQGIDHPNVVGVHDVVEVGRETVVVMAYADGGNLRSLLDRRGRLSPREAVEVVEDVLAGLAAAHEAGVIHRDLKPENLLLTTDDRVMLADFGIAQDQGAGVTAMTAGPVGTLHYMSPEQVRGGQVSKASDLYTVGVILHELVTGRFYLKTAGRDDFQIRQAIVEEAPRLALEDRAPGLEPVVQRALAKDPAQRFASAQAMAEALAERVAVPA